MAYKMKGSTLYGKLKLNRNMDDTSNPDGRAKSSAFQKEEYTKVTDEKSSPAKEGKHTETIQHHKADKAHYHSVKRSNTEQGILTEQRKNYPPEKEGGPGSYMTTSRSGEPGKSIASGKEFEHSDIDYEKRDKRIEAKAKERDTKASPVKGKKDKEDKRSDSEKKIQSKLDARSSTYDYEPATKSQVQLYRDTAARDSKEVNKNVVPSADMTTRETIHRDKQKSHEKGTKWLEKSLRGAKKARKKSDKQLKREAKAKKRAKRDAAIAKSRADRGYAPVVKFKGL